MDTPPEDRVRALWSDERGNVATGYIVVVAAMIAIALATVGLRDPINSASRLAVGCLAGNNP
jgi:hypothetical protein